MNKRHFQGLCLLALMLCLTGCGPSHKLTVDQRRAAVQKMETQTLAQLYAKVPEAKQKVEDAAGYGVFSNANITFFVSGGGGYGVVVDNKTGQRTYMKMALGGLGLGVGVKDYRQVLVFKNRKAMTNFVEKGVDVGADLDVAATTGDKGGAAAAEGTTNKNIEVYTMTKSGLVVQATLAGTKYWKDKDLN